MSIRGSDSHLDNTFTLAVLVDIVFTLNEPEFGSGRWVLALGRTIEVRYHLECTKKHDYVPATDLYAAVEERGL